MILPDLLSGSVERFGPRVALTHNQVNLTYDQLAGSVTAIGQQLRSLGLSDQARVGVYMENSPEYLAAFWAVTCSGFTIVPLDNSSSPETLNFILNDCGLEALFVSPSLRRKLPRLIGGADSLKAVICPAETGLKSDSVDSILMPSVSELESLSGPVLRPARDEDDLAAIFYTSGSTGKSKGVMLSHRNLVSNTIATNEYLELTEQDSIMVVLPFYYIYGNSLLLTHIAAGGRLVIDNRFMYPEVILDTMQSEKVSGFSGVPSNFTIMLGKSTLSERKLPDLRYFTQAGGSMAPETTRKLLEAFPDKQLFIMYGQTEAAPRVTWLPPHRLPEKIGSIGIPLNGISVDIQSPNGKLLPANEAGELVVRGPNVMLGYWNQPVEQALVLKDGALYTGDLGYKDDEGLIWIVGRSKEIIKSGGNRVSAKEVEEAVLLSDAILETAVIGLPDDLLGEAITAVVTLKPGQAVTETELKKHCQAHLPMQKVPQRYFFLDALPKHKTGKVNKLALKEQL